MIVATQHDGNEPDRVDAARWIDVGLAHLTGRFDGAPLGPPVGFLRRLDGLTDRIAAASTAMGRPVEVDGPAELVRRARAMGLRRRGQVSCGGATQLVRAADGWFAVTLARPDDVDLLPAWIGVRPGTDGPDGWRQVHALAGALPVHDVVASGILMGLPIAALPPNGRTSSGSGDGAPHLPRDRPTGCDGAAAVDAEPLHVVDLSSMWAGPLCGAILAEAGADVTKVELAGRPDGARRGPASLFERLNAAKQHVTLDVTSAGRQGLAQLIQSADIVIESARPRALRHLGIDADAVLAEADGPSVWVSITGHGRTGTAADRVAFGDDAAVGGGLVAWCGDIPYFCADAVADPLTGLTAAAAAMESLGSSAPVLLDVAMADVAAAFAGPTAALPETAS